MCLKNGITKRLYLVMNFPPYLQHPYVVGVLPNHPMYRQMYEDTKNDVYLTTSQMNKLRFPLPDESRIRLYELQVPPSYVLQ